MGVLDFITKLRKALDDLDYVLTKTDELAKKHKESLSKLVDDAMSFVIDVRKRIAEATAATKKTEKRAEYEFHVQDDVIVLVGGPFAKKPDVHLLDEKTLLVSDDVLDIPAAVDENNMDIKFKNGVLSIVMRRKKSEREELEIPRWDETSRSETSWSETSWEETSKT